jgi:hypothetical protein
VEIGHTADNAVFFQLTKTVNGKDDIIIALKANPIKGWLSVRHYQIFGLDIARNYAIKIMLAKLKRAIIPPVQTGCRNHCHTALVQWWTVDPRSALKCRTVFLMFGGFCSLYFSKFFETWQFILLIHPALSIHKTELAKQE